MHLHGTTKPGRSKRSDIFGIGPNNEAASLRRLSFFRRFASRIGFGRVCADRFLTDGSPAVIGRRAETKSRLVEKHQLRSVERPLLGDKRDTFGLDVGPILFARD